LLAVCVSVCRGGADEHGVLPGCAMLSIELSYDSRQQEGRCGVRLNNGSSATYRTTYSTSSKSSSSSSSSLLAVVMVDGLRVRELNTCSPRVHTSMHPQRQQADVSWQMDGSEEEQRRPCVGMAERAEAQASGNCIFSGGPGKRKLYLFRGGGCIIWGDGVLSHPFIHPLFLFVCGVWVAS